MYNAWGLIIMYQYSFVNCKKYHINVRYQEKLGTEYRKTPYVFTIFYKYKIVLKLNVY